MTIAEIIDAYPYLEPEDIHQPRFIDLAGNHFRSQGDLRQQASEITRGVWIAPLLFHDVPDQGNAYTTHGVSFRHMPRGRPETSPLEEAVTPIPARSGRSAYATLPSISRVYFP